MFEYVTLQKKQTYHLTIKMAPPGRIIDLEWAETLDGLRMSLPNRWWLGHKGNQLHHDRIVMFVEDTNKWQLLLDNVSDPTHYTMSWEGLLEYADVEAGTYSSYHLPAEPADLPPTQVSW